MLRFDYYEQENETFEVKVVSEEENSSALAGKLILSNNDWKNIQSAMITYDRPRWNRDKWDWEITEKLFKFVNKSEKGEKK